MNGYFYHQKCLPNFDGHCHYWPNSQKYDVASINDDNTCNNDGCSREDKILGWTNIRWWFHSLCYWNIWMPSFLFWFILDRLCIDHNNHASSMVFFNPLDVYFSLLTVCVHSVATCASKNDFSVGYCTWLGSSSLPHIIASAPLSTSQFMTNDNFLVVGLLCYCWSSFCSHGFYLHKVFSFFVVDCLLPFFLQVVSIPSLFCLVLLINGFPSLILKNIYMVFLLWYPRRMSFYTRAPTWYAPNVVLNLPTKYDRTT
jgi:hypothetical protein